MRLQRKVYVGVLGLLISVVYAHDDSHNDEESVNHVSVEKIFEAETQLGTPIVLDRIVATVNGSPVLLSDLSVMRVNDAPFSLDRAILSELYRQEAARRGLLASPAEVDKRFESIRVNLGGGMPYDDFERRLLAEGFTTSQYKRELARLLTEGNVIGSAQQDHVFVTAADVEAYCAANPQEREARYLLKTAMIPRSQAQSEQEASAKAASADWVVADWLNASELNDSVRGVTALKAGEMLPPIAIPYGFQLVCLTDLEPARLSTAQERYTEVEALLMDQKRKAFERTFNEQLRSKANIRFLDPIEMKKKVTG